MADEGEGDVDRDDVDTSRTEKTDPPAPERQDAANGLVDSNGGKIADSGTGLDGAGARWNGVIEPPARSDFSNGPPQASSTLDKTGGNAQVQGDANNPARSNEPGPKSSGRTETRDGGLGGSHPGQRGYLPSENSISPNRHLPATADLTNIFPSLAPSPHDINNPFALAESIADLPFLKPLDRGLAALQVSPSTAPIASLMLKTFANGGNPGAAAGEMLGAMGATAVAEAFLATLPIDAGIAGGWAGAIAFGALLGPEAAPIGVALGEELGLELGAAIQVLAVWYASRAGENIAHKALP